MRKNAEAGVAPAKFYKEGAKCLFQVSGAYLKVAGGEFVYGVRRCTVKVGCAGSSTKAYSLPRQSHTWPLEI